jgi:hypothetical protein
LNTHCTGEYLSICVGKIESNAKIVDMLNTIAPGDPKLITSERIRLILRKEKMDKKFNFLPI